MDIHTHRPIPTHLPFRAGTFNASSGGTVSLGTAPADDTIVEKICRSSQIVNLFAQWSMALTT